MNDVSIFDRHTCTVASENESANLVGQIDSPASGIAASKATDINNVSELSANLVANFKTRYLQLKKQNIAS